MLQQPIIRTKKCRFLEYLKGVMADMPTHRMIMCGDMNIKLGANDSNASFQNTRASKALNKLLQEFALVDVWRELFPTTKRYTWRRTRPLQQSRLDYIFISDNLFRCRQAKSRIDPGFLSDHSFVYAEIDARNPSRGPGIWTMEV